MSIELIDMNTFEYINPEKDTLQQSSDSSLFVRVAAADDARYQRAVVRNAFLTRVETDPTPSPYDSVPLNFWRSDSKVSTRAIPSTPSNVKSYYDSKAGNLYFTDRTTS